MQRTTRRILPLILLLISAAALAGCTRKIYIPVETTTTDTTRTARADTLRTAHTDTLRLTTLRRDSIARHDSIITIIKGDTILIKEYHYRDRYRTHAADQYHARTDDTHRARTDTIIRQQTQTITRTITTPAPLRWWQKLLQYTGALSWLTLLLAAAYAVIKASRRK